MNGNKTSAARGKAGEDAVCEYLEKAGWRIVKRNYRIPGAEIDIIAENGEEIAFTEVKTRKFGSLTEGSDAMTAAKKRRIVLAAERFLSENGFDELQPRFDTAYVTVTTESVPRILELEYYDSDFDATGVYR